MANANLNGFLGIWKPRGMTSFDVVRRLRRASNVKRVGHGGTLDPAAEGVLPILFGQATRLSSRIEELAKGYEAEVLLGTMTDTLDMDGTVLETRPTDGVTEDAVRAITSEFIGEIQQAPPMYSAVKHRGERLYAIARRGEEVQREPRAVMVYAIDIQSVSLPRVRISVTCGRGMYVRSLAADIGERLGCGGVLDGLQRVRVGPFNQRNSLGLEEAEEALTGERAADALLPLETVFPGWPAVQVRSGFTGRVRSGMDLAAASGDWVSVPGESDDVFCPGPEAGNAVALAPDGSLLALLQRAESGRWHPRTVFGGS